MLELLLSVGEVIREQDDAGSAFETLEELKWADLSEKATLHCAFSMRNGVIPQGSDSSNDLK
jgi:hypothetical protein